MADRFGDRRSLPRPLPCLQPVVDGLLGQARLGEVVGEQFRLRLDGLRELRLQHLGDPPVELLPLALDQRVVQRVLEQGVLEDVGAARRPTLRIQDLGLHQLGRVPPGASARRGRNGASNSWLNSRPRTAASWANSRPPSIRSRRAITRSWSVLRESHAPNRVGPCAPSAPCCSRMADSCTIFVNSSTNSGTPPVRS